ncbi:maestro heat-like repeat-containing protein family member 2B, partial [Alligator sinensis]|uniref:Maestro heat-like repeat-containing protein family member 2B n=1 Tax=Alligator sinensis TaxID=38654 RepID=A0A3Q0FVQ6_ALLSI
MYEMQSHGGIMQLPPLFSLITLGDLASAYALRSEPFLVRTLSKLCFVLRLVETKMKQALLVQGFAHAPNMKLRVRDEIPFPINQIADNCFYLLPFFNLMSSSWLSSEDPEQRAPLQQAAVKVLGPTMDLLLHHEGHHDTVFERLPCLLWQYEESVDKLHVTVSLSQVLEVAYDLQILLPDGKLENFSLTMHKQ